VSDPLGGSHARSALREVVALLWVAGYLFVCITLITLSGPRAWFSTALAMFMLGQALGHLSISPNLTRSRKWLGLPLSQGYRLKVLVYVVAGLLAMLGALTSLSPAFGLIVAFGAFCWVCVWVWILVQFQPSKASYRPASPDTIS
jgi:hypothetical protein